MSFEFGLHNESCDIISCQCADKNLILHISFKIMSRIIKVLSAHDMVLSWHIKVCHDDCQGLSWYCQELSRFVIVLSRFVMVVMVCHGLSRFVTVCHKVVMVCHRDKPWQKKGLFDHDKKSLYSRVKSALFFDFSVSVMTGFFYVFTRFFFVTITICDKTWQSILSPWQTPWQDFGHDISVTCHAQCRDTTW